MILILLSLAALAPTPVAGSVSDGVEAQLGALESTSSDERRRAQRWLTANLEVAHFAHVALAAEGGGEELRARLVEALAGDDRHFELSALLASESSSDVELVGRRALGELCLRWSPAADDDPDRHVKVRSRLASKTVARYSIAFDRRSLQENVELLARIGDSEVALVLDPDLLRSPNFPELAEDASGTHVGDEAELLERMRDAYGLGLDGFVYETDGDLAWARLCKRVRESRKPARELLIEWCVRVVKRRSPSDARACARALAASGWPAVLRWMEWRYRERGDEACLQGLISAAASGRVVPNFSSTGGQAVLLERARASLESGDHVTFSRIARALAATGPTSPTGALLSAELTRPTGPAFRWLGLVAIEGRGGGEESVGGFVESSVFETDAAIATQALRAARAIALKLDDALELEHCERLFGYGARRDGGRELVRLLIATRLAPPERVVDRALASWDAEARLALAEWSFFRSEDVAAARLLTSVLEQGDLAREVDEDPAHNTPVLRLRDWSRAAQADRARELFELVFASEIDSRAKQRATRVALHAGLLPRDLEVELGARLFLASERGDLEESDLLALGALAASPRGAEARRILIEISVGSRRQKQPLVTRPALDEAVRVLRERRMDSQVEAFVEAVKTIHTRRLAAAPWPPPHRPEVVPASILERTFEP